MIFFYDECDHLKVGPRMENISTGNGQFGQIVVWDCAETSRIVTKIFDILSSLICCFSDKYHSANETLFFVCFKNTSGLSRVRQSELLISQAVIGQLTFSTGLSAFHVWLLFIKIQLTNYDMGGTLMIVWLIIHKSPVRPSENSE